MRIKRPSGRLILNTAVAVVGIVAVGWIWQDRYLKDEFSDTDFSRYTDTNAVATSTTIALQERSYKVGDCITWNQDEGRSSTRLTRVVRCEEPHLMEYTATVRHPARLLEPAPTEAQWDEFINLQCAKPAESHIGYPIDPYGRFYLSAVYPTDESWKSGERNVQCGIQAQSGRADEGDRIFEFIGAVKDQQQTLLPSVGACFHYGQEAGEVDCSQPHQAEVTGIAQVNAAEYPANDEAMRAGVGTQCDRKAREYLGKTVPEGYSATWNKFEESSWDAGQRTVACTLVKFAGADAVETTGSLRQ